MHIFQMVLESVTAAESMVTCGAHNWFLASVRSLVLFELMELTNWETFRALFTHKRKQLIVGDVMN